MINIWKLIKTTSFLAATILVVSACGGGGGGGGGSAPAAPTSLVATFGNGQVALSWTSVAGATSYNVYSATSPGVISGPGTLVASGITSPSIVVSSLINGTSYSFVVTAVNANGESIKSNEASATPAPSASFTQADLTGTWHFMLFMAGPQLTAGGIPGWVRGTITTDDGGNVTITSIADSENKATIPAAGSTTHHTIDANGVVTESGDPIYAAGWGNHVIMAANKQLMVGTATVGNDGTDRSIRIFVKQAPGVTFSGSDLANKSFAFHELHSGSDNIWVYGGGSIDGSLQRTTSSVVTPTGPGALPAAESLSISADGSVTSDDPTYLGIMTSDKKTVFGTSTNGNQFRLRIFQITGGQTFNQADIAGTWQTYGLGSSSSSPEWSYGAVIITSTGVGTVTAFRSSDGTTTPPPPPDNTFTFNLSASGTLTSANDPTINGTVSYYKDLVVFTETRSVGIYGMTIVVK